MYEDAIPVAGNTRRRILGGQIGRAAQRSCGIPNLKDLMVDQHNPEHATFERFEHLYVIGFFQHHRPTVALVDSRTAWDGFKQQNNIVSDQDPRIKVIIVSHEDHRVIMREHLPHIARFGVSGWHRH